MPSIFQKRKSHGEVANGVVAANTLVDGLPEGFQDDQNEEADRRRREIECYVSKLKQAGGGVAREFAIEVEKVLKKAHDGIHTFEDYFAKFHATDNTGLRRNYEKGMRTEIKKIQRLRDQVKIWLLMGDAKDPGTLLSIKKDIENRMQRFRALEHDVRVRDYSDATLANPGGKMPKVLQDFSDLSKWLTGRLTIFETEINLVESELEEFVLGSRKRMDQDTKDREVRLRKYLDKHNHHVGMLEKLLRILNILVHDIKSPALPEFIKQVDHIKDEIDYYLDDYQYETYEDNDFLYDDITALQDYQEIVDNPFPLATSHSESEEKDDDHSSVHSGEVSATSQDQSLCNGKKTAEIPSKENNKLGKNLSKTDLICSETKKWSITDLVNKHKRDADATNAQGNNGGNGDSSVEPESMQNGIISLMDISGLDPPDSSKLKKPIVNCVPPKSTIWSFIESTCPANTVSSINATLENINKPGSEEEFPVLGELVGTETSSTTPISISPRLWPKLSDAIREPDSNPISPILEDVLTIETCIRMETGEQFNSEKDVAYVPESVPYEPKAVSQAKYSAPLVQAELGNYSVDIETSNRLSPEAEPERQGIFASTPITSGSSKDNSYEKHDCKGDTPSSSGVNTNSLDTFGNEELSIVNNFNVTSPNVAKERLILAQRKLREHKDAARKLKKEIRRLERLVGDNDSYGSDYSRHRGNGNSYTDDESSSFCHSQHSTSWRKAGNNHLRHQPVLLTASLLPTNPIKLSHSPTFAQCNLGTMGLGAEDYTRYNGVDDSIFLNMYLKKEDIYKSSFAAGILQYRNWKLGIEDGQWYLLLQGPEMINEKLVAYYTRYNRNTLLYEYLEVPLD